MNFIEGTQLTIQRETLQDIEGIHRVIEEAFGRGNEAQVVDELRKNSKTFISLVAKIGQEVVGHILFTPVIIRGSNRKDVEGLGLAPLAVSPDYQGQGVGTALCKAGLSIAKDAGSPYVVVLGSPRYYPRFGFKPASYLGIRCAYEDIPQEDFMIVIFDEERMSKKSGVAYYRPEFDSVS